MRLFFERQIVGMAFTSPTKGWLQVNNELCRMLGYSREELSGVTWVELTHPDDLRADLEQFERLLAGAIDEYSMEKRFIRKDGSVVEVEITSHPLAYEGRPAKLVMAMDVAERGRLERERRRSQAELAQSEASLRTIVDNAVFGMYRSTPDGRFTMVNRTLAEMLGSVAEFYDEETGRPNRPVALVLGTLILKEASDLTDEEALEPLEFDLQ